MSSGITTSAPNDIVLFHYKASPFGRRVNWYLQLRGIQYAECIQPPILPRPDMEALGVNYRRSPVMAIGRDVYTDTRLIISKLEELFPATTQHPALSTPGTAGLAALLQKLSVDVSVFRNAVAQIPRDSALMKDPKFQKDRASFFESNGKLNEGRLVRPEAIAHMRQLFDIMESLLVDGRRWIGGTSTPSLADLEGVWGFDWFIKDLKPDSRYFSRTLYPSMYSWVERFRAALEEAKSRAVKPKRMSGDEAVQFITTAQFTDQNLEIHDDPLAMQAGDIVEVFPLDGGGITQQDRGQLVKLTKDEVAIAKKARSGQEIHLHAPRWQFRVRKIDSKGARL